MELLKFGDVFRYREKDYIFLAKTEDIVYACEILNMENTRKINDLYEYRSKRNENCINQRIFCFITLQTKEFKDRMAHFAKTEQSDAGFDPDRINVELDKEDLIKIKKEIENPNSPMSGGLKKIIKDIDI